MLGVTLFGIFLTPVFFYVIDRLGTLYEHGPHWLHVALRPVGFILYYLAIAATLGIPLLVLALNRWRLPASGKGQVPSVNGFSVTNGTVPEILPSEELVETQPPAG
jgi:hypothetical protein